MRMTTSPRPSPSRSTPTSPASVRVFLPRCFACSPSTRRAGIRSCSGFGTVSVTALSSGTSFAPSLGKILETWVSTVRPTASERAASWSQASRGERGSQQRSSGSLSKATRSTNRKSDAVDLRIVGTEYFRGLLTVSILDGRPLADHVSSTRHRPRPTRFSPNLGCFQVLGLQVGAHLDLDLDLLTAHVCTRARFGKAPRSSIP